MGVPKQTLNYRGSTLLRHTVDTALSVAIAPVIVVLGANAARDRTELEGSGVLITENSAWRGGMAGSLRVGLNALLHTHPSIDAVLFLVCDQPMVSAVHLENLIATHARTGAPIVASEYNETLGVPALFARVRFPELLGLNGDRGARQVIHAHRDQAIGIPCEDGAFDIDTPADYARLISTDDNPSGPA